MQPGIGLRLPACGKMVCRPINTGNGTHSKDQHPDSPEKAEQGRRICGHAMIRPEIGTIHIRPPSIGDANGVAVRHKPETSTPLRKRSKNLRENAVSIFLGLQGENLAEGCGGEQPPHSRFSPPLFFRA